MVQNVSHRTCHMHTHLCECVLDFGPVYASGCFRLNGTTVSWETSKRITAPLNYRLMRKFLRDQAVQEIPCPDTFRSDFEPLIKPMGQSGNTGRNADLNLCSRFVLLHRCAMVRYRALRLWNEISLYRCLPPSSLDCLDEHEVPYLTAMYNQLSPDVQEESVFGNFETVLRRRSWRRT
ncbi:hypothetical protein OS493_039228, partial [Desmophyllum pertusum]